jgi:two-component system, OmpR family, phosphate regulon sensor histidine kinase PhoR
MSRRPFLFRLFLPFVITAVVMAGVAGVILYWVGRDNAHRDQLQAMELFADIIRNSSTTDSHVISPAAQRQLADAARIWAGHFVVVDGSGAVLFDSQADGSNPGNLNDRPEIIRARQHHIADPSRLDATEDTDATNLAMLIDQSAPDGPVIFASFPLPRWPEYQTPVWLVIAGGLTAAGLTVSLLALILQRQWISPTRRLVGAAEMMAAGQWHARVDPHGADDVRFLAGKMNLLASHAENQLAEIGKQRRDLRSLVDTLPDPILVTDSAGRVLLINAPAAELLQLAPAQVIGKKTVSVVSDEALLQLLDAARNAPTDDSSATSTPQVQREVRLVRGGQRLTYQSVATPTATGGVLLLLRDVSTMANTLQMKTDFVANASHELRTPIAAIKIAMETLRDVYGDDQAQSERCINIIEGHIRRLEEMLRDLLDLSRLESPDAQPKLAEVKPWDLFAVVRSTMGPTARQRGIDLRLNDAPETPDSFQSDERLLHLVLKNLVENSVKFTPAGGSITVSIVNTNGVHTDEGQGRSTVAVSVADTGIGIPPEHRDRVFERFYQVDAARSGTAGRGTGLGLAIVKHAVAALGGTVKLESTVGRGTTVTCVLPQGELMSASAEQTLNVER